MCLRWRCLDWVRDSEVGYQLPTLDDELLTLTLAVKSLDVILETSFSVDSQITNVARLTFFYLLQVRQLVPFLSLSELATVICGSVTSVLNYCNVLCAGLSLKLIRKLQLDENVVAQVLTETLARPHIQLVFFQLH